MIANYHTHSRWCKHATGEFSDYFKKAVELGFKEIAMTDHVCHRYSWCWLDFNDIGEFDAQLNAAIEEYRDRIKILKGFECEYLPEEMDTYRYLRDELGYEFLIMGQHCDSTGRINAFNITKPDEVKAYGQSVCEGLATGMFKMLAHPDVFLIEYKNWDRTCEEIFHDIFTTCESLRIPIEINTNGYRGKRGYPSFEMLEFSKRYDLRYLINSDAHDPEHLYDEPVKACEREVAEHGIHVCETFDETK